jgi:large subunit ribosomal protein L30e
MIDVNKAIAAAVKTGKVSFGANAALQNAKTGKAKMVILAANCPKDIKEEIEYNCKLSNVPVMMYKGAAMDLATACNKPFIISALSIRETGDSEILKVMEDTEMQEYTGGNE